MCALARRSTRQSGGRGGVTGREKRKEARERERRARVERDRENSEKDGRKIKIIRRIVIN